MRSPVGVEFETALSRSRNVAKQPLFLELPVKFFLAFVYDPLTRFARYESDLEVMYERVAVKASAFLFGEYMAADRRLC